MTALGSRLRQLREAHGLTVRDLGERIGKTPGYISRIEARNEIPSAELLCVIADIYNVDATELLQLAKEVHLKRTASDIDERYRVALALYRKQTP